MNGEGNSDEFAQALTWLNQQNGAPQLLTKLLLAHGKGQPGAQGLALGGQTPSPSQGIQVKRPPPVAPDKGEDDQGQPVTVKAGTNLLQSPSMLSIGGAQKDASQLSMGKGEVDPNAFVQGPLLRGMAYGPGWDKPTKATTQGHFGDLQKGDIAVSPNILDKYPMGSRWDVVDANGKVVLPNARVADTSWIKPGQPTHNSFEIWGGPDVGEGRLVPVSTSGGGGATNADVQAFDSWLGTGPSLEMLQ